MRTLRTIYRLVRVLFMLYGAWNAVMKSRWFTVTLAMIRMLRRRRVRDVNRKAALTFVDGSEPAIYRRQGWRRIELRRDRQER